MPLVWPCRSANTTLYTSLFAGFHTEICEIPFQGWRRTQVHLEKQNKSALSSNDYSFTLYYISICSTLFSIFSSQIGIVDNQQSQLQHSVDCDIVAACEWFSFILCGQGKHYCNCSLEVFISHYYSFSQLSLLVVQISLLLCLFFFTQPGHYRHTSALLVDFLTLLPSSSIGPMGNLLQHRIK